MPSSISFANASDTLAAKVCVFHRSSKHCLGDCSLLSTLVPTPKLYFSELNRTFKKENKFMSGIRNSLPAKVKVSLFNLRPFCFLVFFLVGNENAVFFSTQDALAQSSCPRHDPHHNSSVSSWRAGTTRTGQTKYQSKPRLWHLVNFKRQINFD